MVERAGVSPASRCFEHGANGARPPYAGSQQQALYPEGSLQSAVVSGLSYLSINEMETTRIERASIGCKPIALPIELHPRIGFPHSPA